MIIFVILAAGVLIGAKFFPPALKKWNEKLQYLSIALLLFAMGISLGSRENFWEELLTLGFDSLILALLPMILSAIFVYLITKKLFK